MRHYHRDLTLHTSFNMSYTYLLDLYKVLATRIADIDSTIEEAQQLSASQRQHLTGRRDCLESIHRFLEEHYDRKLPRRLQRQSPQRR